MRIRFDEQLNMLTDEIKEMGILCEQAISYSVEGLVKKDENLFEKANKADYKIDKMEREIETLCLRILLHEQPVATDLRRVSSALKMISDMERIGDMASDIAEIGRHWSGDYDISKTKLRLMADETIKMLIQSVDAFIDRDIKKAHNVIEYDDVVDTLFDEIKSELANAVSCTEFDGEYYTNILMTAKYLERVADHATNIAEWVEYSITGVYKNGKLL